MGRTGLAVSGLHSGEDGEDVDASGMARAIPSASPCGGSVRPTATCCGTDTAAKAGPGSRTFFNE